MPYQEYSDGSRSASSGSSAYPPLGSRGANDSLANLASASTHTLVPPGRPSLAEARGPAGVSMPSTSFPPLRQTWGRIYDWSENHYFELKDTLNWPATEMQVEELESVIGFHLPAAVRDSYLCHNGQELESNQSCSDGIFFGLALLSLEQIAEEWKFWRAVDDDPTSGASQDVRRWQSSCPDKWVRPEYSCKGWIPLITDHVGNYIGVDMTPYPSGGGTPGQVIIFGRDFDTKVVLWRGEGEGGWGRFLQYVAEELESGEMWTLEDNSGGSDDEEDAIGYESYFSGGGAGASKGGGDRGGMGSAGFRLAGEYKGWPVLEAWADRSMRCWEEVGLPSGMPIGQVEEAQQLEQENTQAPGTPTVRLSAPDDRSEGSSSGLRNSTSEPQDAEPHPLQAGQGLGLGLPTDGRPFSPTTDSTQHHPAQSNERRLADTLSPPPSASKAAMQKQKQRDFSGSSTATQRERRAPPAPSQALDLPTIDDVRAVHAAALAERERSANVQYTDLRNATASMSTLSLGRNGTLRAGSRGNDSLELNDRTSSESKRNRYRDVSLAGVVVHGEPRRSLNSPRQDSSPRTSSDGRTTNFFDTSLGAIPPPGRNLLDSSTPSSPILRSGAISPSCDYGASPLAAKGLGVSAGAGGPVRNGMLERVASPDPSPLMGPRASTPHYEDSPYQAREQTA